jgi:hypothetical protein
MGSQLLFGEMVEVMETKGRQWSKVRCLIDNYIGWVRASQLKAITPSEMEEYQDDFAYNLDLVQPAISADYYLPITMGARLPNFDGMRFRFGETYYNFTGQAVFPQHIEPTIDFVLKIARRYLFAPQLWGGRSPMGIDASGFTQMVFRLAGIAMPRLVQQQLDMGKKIEFVDFVELSLPGDLAFFENKAGRIHHVGIIMPDRQIIHVHGAVRIDNLDHLGIFNVDTQRYTHKLRVIKRILKPVKKVLSKSNNEKTSVSTSQIPLF